MGSVFLRILRVPVWCIKRAELPSFLGFPFLSSLALTMNALNFVSQLC
jgi:hypothetical protein